MGPRHRSRFLIAIVLLLSVFAIAGEPTWMEVRSPNFTVLTNAGERKGRDTAFRFEQMRRIFTSLLARDRANLIVPLQVVVFRDSTGLRQVAPLYQGKPVEAAGIFLPGDDRNYIAIDGSADAGWETVFHEYSHLLLAINLPSTPQWFEEGFAEYFTSVKIDKKGARIGEPPAGALQVLQGGLMPVEQLFAVTSTSKDYNAGSRRTLFYAESWLVVKYLFDKKKITEAGRFMALMQNEKLAPADAMQQAFGMGLKDFDAALKQFLQQSEGTVWTLTPPEVTDPTLYVSHKLKDDDALAILADMHLHSTDHFEQAAAEFQQVLAHSPMNSAANRGMGYYFLKKDQPAKAGEYFRHAAAAGSTDARVYYYNAYFTFTKTQNAPVEPADLIEMDQSLDQAIQLDPGYADAFSLKAWVLARSHNYSEAVRVMQHAVKLAPRNDQFKANLATQLMNNRQFDESMALWEKLKLSSDPAVAAQATRTLARMTELKGRNMLQVAVENESDITAPQWRRSPDAPPPSEDEDSDSDQQDKGPKPDTRPIHFVKGVLQEVDCSAKPGATFTVVTAAKKKMTLKVKNTGEVAVIGADKFNCDWRQTRVSVNYRESGPDSGDVVSVELK